MWDRVVALMEWQVDVQSLGWYSAVLAENLSVSLQLLHVVRPLDLPFEPEVHEDILDRFNKWAQEEAEKKLIGVVTRLKKDFSCEIGIVARIGHPVEESLQLLSSGRPLAVIMLEKERGLKRVLGDSAEKVVRKAQSSVLVLPPDPKIILKEPPIQRILVGVDFSPASERALIGAKNLSTRLKAKLTGLYVQPLLQTRSKKKRDEIEILRRLAMERAQTLSKDWGNKYRVNILLKEGEPVEEILKFAKNEHIDLIVAGSRGRSNVPSTFLGSTASLLLKTHLFPLLVLR